MLKHGNTIDLSFNDESLQVFLKQNNSHIKNKIKTRVNNKYYWKPGKEWALEAKWTDIEISQIVKDFDKVRWYEVQE